MTFFDAITITIHRSAWSVKIYQRSDRLHAMIMDFTGSFLIGPTESHDKKDYSKPFMLAAHLIQADNWDMFTNCKWDE